MVSSCGLTFHGLELPSKLRRGAEVERAPDPLVCLYLSPIIPTAGDRVALTTPITVVFSLQNCVPLTTQITLVFPLENCRWFRGIDC